eukprot:9734956-Alexandrium_andersonii.AAC.1
MPDDTVGIANLPDLPSESPGAVAAAANADCRFGYDSEFRLGFRALGGGKKELYKRLFIPPGSTDVDPIMA